MINNLINNIVDFFRDNIPSKRTIIIGGFAIYLLIIIIIFATHSHDDTSKEASNKVSQKETASYENDILEDIKKRAKSIKNQTDDEDNEADKAVQKKNKKSVKSQIDFDAEYPFEIRINRAENFATVYGINKKGKYKLVYKTFRCSTGKNPESTPLGTFHSYEDFRWHQMVDGSYSQYCIRIFGAIMLHSVPYERPESDALEYWEYNKLGKPASLGCIRFCAGDMKWIYDHCPLGTNVIIYEKEGEKPPIDLKKLTKIKESDKYSGWDPTDPDKNNPWKKKGN